MAGNDQDKKRTLVSNTKQYEKATTASHSRQSSPVRQPEPKPPPERDLSDLTTGDRESDTESPTKKTPFEPITISSEELLGKFGAASIKSFLDHGFEPYRKSIDTVLQKYETRMEDITRKLSEKVEEVQQTMDQLKTGQSLMCTALATKEPEKMVELAHHFQQGKLIDESFVKDFTKTWMGFREKKDGSSDGSQEGPPSAKRAGKLPERDAGEPSHSFPYGARPVDLSRTSYRNPSFLPPPLDREPTFQRGPDRSQKIDEVQAIEEDDVESHSSASSLGLTKFHVSPKGKEWADQQLRFTRKSTLRPSDIGEFDGKQEEVFQFVRKIQDTVETSGVDDGDIVKMIPRCLTGRAQYWYMGLTKDQRDRMLCSTTTFIQGLQQEYQQQTRRELQLAIAYFYHPSEHPHIADYYYQKIAKHRSVEPDISDRDLIDEVYRGLEKKAPGLARMVAVRQFRVLEEFKEELFFKFESFLNMERASKKKNKEGSTKKRDKKGNKKVTKKEKEKEERDGKGRWKGKAKKKPSEVGGRPCSNCQKDHWDNECDQKENSKDKEKTKGGKKDKKVKGYVMGYQEDSDEEEDVSSSSEEDSEESSSSDDDSESNSHSYYFSAASYFANGSSPFFGSRKISTDHLDISTLPKRESVGSGMDFLSASPLPIEIFTVAEGAGLGTQAESIRACADTGGQGLIDSEVLHSRHPDVVIRQHEKNPRFSGIGSGTESSLGWVCLDVLFPNQEALEGGEGRRVTRITAEFQVVKRLDCNMLIGRELLKGHGVRIIEDQGILAFPDGNSCPILDIPKKLKATPTPKKIYAATGRFVRPGEEISLEIRDPGLSDRVTLCLDPILQNRRNQALGGFVPRCTIRGNQKWVRFRNFSTFPIRLSKGEPLALVEECPSNSPSCQVTEPEDTWHSAIRQLNLFVKSTKSEEAKRKAKSIILDLRKLAAENEMQEDVVELGLEESRAKRDGDDLAMDGESNPSQDLAMGGESTPGPDEIQDEPESPIFKGYTTNLETRGGADDLGLEDEFPNDEKDTVEIPLEKSQLPRQSNKKDNLPLPKLKVRINPRVDVSRMIAVLRRHASVFGFEGRRLGALEKEMTLETSKIPPPQAPYRESPRTKQIIDDAFKTLLQHDIIEPSESPTASPVVCVLQHGKYRFCVDFRRLNEYTPPMKYPLPRPDSIFNALGGKQYFSTVDANKGYHQFAINPKSRQLTAFVTESKGLWQYKRVPFGLKNAPAFFQQSMDEILGSMRWDYVLAYIDDVIIYSHSYDDHLNHVDKVLAALESVGMTIDERKCFFGYESLNLLGHRINRLGLMTQPNKVAAIQNLPFPTTVKALQVVLGQFTYYRQFIPKYSLVARPLFEALKLKREDDGEQEAEREGKEVKAEGGLEKGVEKKVMVRRKEKDERDKKRKKKENEKEKSEDAKARARVHGRQKVERTPERETCLQKLKDLLSAAPVLRHPDFDKPFVLHTDGCKAGLAATLEQEDEEKKRHPVLYISRSLKSEEQRYTATEIECLGVYWSLHKLAPYVEGSAGLTLITDHSALKWIWEVSPTTNSRLYRWSLLLGPLKDKVVIEHRAGRLHSNVDPISRHPLPETYWMDPRPVVPRRSYHSAVISTIATEDFHLRYREAVRLEQKVPDGLVEKDGLRFREKHGSFRLWVPSTMRPEILMQMHDGTAHPGQLRTWVNLKSSFWWKGAKAETMEYVKTCHHCQLEKARTTKPHGSLQPILSAPLPSHTISIDFIDELPEVDGINRLATHTCKFTKGIILVPLKMSTKAPEYAKKFVEVVYPRWGFPSKIVSDRDSRFISNFWKCLTSLLHVQVAMTTPYHPQADGQSERTNRTVETMLRIYIFSLMDKYKETNWLRLLPIVEFEYNLTMNLSTGFAPFDLLYAERPRRPIERAILQAKRDEAPEKGALKLVEELEVRRKVAVYAIKKSQAFQKKYYDLRHSPLPEFREGEKVILLPYAKAGKVDRHGRCVRIRAKVSPLAYRIRVPDGSRMHDVVSIAYLKKYHRRRNDEREDSSDDEDGGDKDERGVEEVKEVIGERLWNGKKEFLVRWKDYDTNDITWVPEEEMGSAMEAVNDWKASWG